MNWKIEIFQNNRVLHKVNNVVNLAKRPFSIIVKIPKPLTVMLNVFEDDTNFQRVSPGFNLDLKKNGYLIHPFVKGMGFAEDYFNKDETLILEKKGHHSLFYMDEHKHRWSEVNITNTGFVFKRKVSKIKIGGEIVPIENISKPRMYFLFLVKIIEGNFVSSDELMKLIFKFS